MPVVLLMHMLALAVWGQAVNAQPVTITVPDDYPTIQEAINHAGYQDMIYVKAGTYYENVVVNRSVTLVGESRQSIIDGNRSGAVITIRALNVTISGLTIRNGGDFSGISLFSSEAKLIDNNITSNWCGIEYDSTRGNIVFSNSITNNLNGISGQWLSESAVTGNIIANNLLGIRLSDSRGNAITSNDIRNHRDAGVSVWNSYQNVIDGNNILLNNEGNYSSAIVIGHSSYNKFHHNNIINRGKQVDFASEPAQINIWDDDYPSGGNYWSDYSGSDRYSGPFQNITGSDGIGDTLYTIAVENADRYPLAQPYTQLAVILNLTEYYEALANFVNLQSKYDDLMSRHNSLQAELNDLRSEFDGLQSEYNSLTNELSLTRNMVYALLITTTVFIAATFFLSKRKLKAGPNEPPLRTRLKESIASANHRVYAMVSSSLDRFSITSLGTLYVFLTVVDIAQTLWGFPEYEVGVLARVFIVLLSDRAWLYFPFRIILTSLIVIAVYKLTTPNVSKKLFLILSLMTLAAVIWNTYTLIMSVA